MQYLLRILVSIVFAGVFTDATAQLSYKQTPPHIMANAFWAFVDENGLDFSNGSPPLHVPTALAPQLLPFGEVVASASDPYTGSLLFYTNGTMVWDRNHNLMPNGTGLRGNELGTTRQGACIVPIPGDSTRFYIFSLGSIQTDSSGLFYSIVDMTLNNGDGEIVASSKNTQLLPDILFTEALVAIPGNNCNVWLLTHEFRDPAVGGSSKYLAFEITSSGINAIPVESYGICDSLGSINYLAVSPDRNTVALLDYGSGYMSAVFGIAVSELVRFDPNTGSVSNGVPLFPSDVHWDTLNPADIVLNSYSLAEFSPNSELLYVIQERTAPSALNILYQFDLSVWDSLSINSSKTFIDTLPYVSIVYGASLKLYNDSLYVLYQNNHIIGRVDQPDISGSGCGFHLDAFSLPFPPFKTGASATNLPDVVYAYSDQSTLLLDTAVCGAYTLRPGDDSFGEYLWSDQSMDSVLTIETPGTYWVQYSYFENNCIVLHTDSFKVASGTIYPEPVINISVDTLGTPGSYSSYQWMKDGTLISGATSPTYVVTENGEYQVIVSDQNGCVDTSGVYEVTNKETSIYSIPGSASIAIYPNPSDEEIFIDSRVALDYRLFQLDGKQVMSGVATRSLSIRHLASGVYLLKLFDKSGQLVTYAKINKR